MTSLRRSSRGPTTLAGLAVVSVIALLLVGPAGADSPTGVVNATINATPATPPPVLSLTVSPTSISYCTTTSPLTQGNGQCDGSSAVTVTMGTSAGHIDVNGADAVPSDNGTPWTLCGAQGASCSGSSGPGANEYNEVALSPDQSTGMTLGNSPVCDVTLRNGGSDCTLAAGASFSQPFVITGPASWTDTSATFTTSIVYTAVP